MELFTIDPRHQQAAETIVDVLGDFHGLEKQPLPVRRAVRGTAFSLVRGAGEKGTRVAELFVEALMDQVNGGSVGTPARILETYRQGHGGTLSLRQEAKASGQIAALLRGLPYKAARPPAGPEPISSETVRGK